jgi:hypothetical protein
VTPVVVPDEFEVVEDFELLPHAATTTNAAHNSATLATRLL